MLEVYTSYLQPITCEFKNIRYFTFSQANTFMKIRLLIKFFIILSISSIIATQALAKDYIIDIVLFEYVDTQALSDYSDKLYYPVSRNAVSLGSEKANNAGFLLHRSNDKIRSIASKLKSSGRYNLIEHLAWRQPGLAENQARPIRINFGNPVDLYLSEQSIADRGLIQAVNARDLAASQAPIPESEPVSLEAVQSTELAGTLTISLGRYLHLDTNLVLTKIDGSGSTRMQISRRMRSKQIHYLDNPRFGLIALIIPIDEPDG